MDPFDGEGEALELDREIHGAERHRRGNLDAAVGEVQDSAHSRRDEALSDGLRGARRNGDHADLEPEALGFRLERVDVVDRELAPLLSDALGAHVEDTHDVESLAAEFLVGVERGAEVPRPYERHLPATVQAEDEADLAAEAGHV